MAKFQKVECRCGVCGQGPWNGGIVNLPTGWGLECASCRTGTPGTPRKTVRHCSMCRKSIVVFGVSGGVRLVCPECAQKDQEWEASERLVRERDQARTELEYQRNRVTHVQGELDELHRQIEVRVEQATKQVLDANRTLQDQVKEREEEALAARIAAAKRRQYGPGARETVISFLKWSADRGYKTWEEIHDTIDNLDEYLDN